jgi:hypothetical protein
MSTSNERLKVSLNQTQDKKSRISRSPSRIRTSDIDTFEITSLLLSYSQWKLFDDLLGLRNVPYYLKEDFSQTCSELLIYIEHKYSFFFIFFIYFLFIYFNF